MNPHANFTSFKPVLSRARVSPTISNYERARRSRFSCSAMNMYETSRGTALDTTYGTAYDIYKAVKDRWADVIYIDTSEVKYDDFTLNNVLTKFGLTLNDPFCVCSDFKNETDYWNTPPAVRYRHGFSWSLCYENMRFVIELATNFDLQSKIPSWIHRANEAEKNNLSNVKEIPVTLTFEEAQAYYELLYGLLSIDDRCLSCELSMEWHDLSGCLHYDENDLRYLPPSYMFSNVVTDRLVDLAINDGCESSDLDRNIVQEIKDNLPFWIRCCGVSAYDNPY